MRCKICGARLTKEGDICSNCYKTYQEEEELKKDTKQRLVIKRKYSISYNLLKYWWVFVIFILSSIISLNSGDLVYTVGLIGSMLVLIGLFLFLDKRLAMGTKAIFYDKKVVYTFKFLFIDREKTVKYSDIKDVTIFKPSLLQSRYGYGDICIYAKGAIPGSSLLNGFQIKNVEDASEVLDEIVEIVAPSEE